MTNRLQELQELEKTLLEARESCNQTKRALTKKIYSVRNMIRVEKNKYI